MKRVTSDSLRKAAKSLGHKVQVLPKNVVTIDSMEDFYQILVEASRQVTSAKNSEYSYEQFVNDVALLQATKVRSKVYID